MLAVASPPEAAGARRERIGPSAKSGLIYDIMVLAEACAVLARTKGG